jgi:putative hydrolase of the HAD superfamily
MGVAAVGFDLGETLLTYADTPLSWVPLYGAALERVAKEWAITLTPDQIARATEILNHYNTRLRPRLEEVSGERIFREILRAWNLGTALPVYAGVAAFFGFFQQRLQPYPESAEVLTMLRSRQVRIGALTDVPYGMPRAYVERDLANASLDSLLDVLITSVDVNRRKPDPTGFRELARRLGTEPRELWFVGNEEKDITGALAAGVTAILLDRDGLAPSWGQHRTVRDLRELL